MFDQSLTHPQFANIIHPQTGFGQKTDLILLICIAGGMVLAGLAIVITGKIKQKKSRKNERN